MYSTPWCIAKPLKHLTLWEVFSYFSSFLKGNMKICLIPLKLLNILWLNFCKTTLSCLLKSYAAFPLLRRALVKHVLLSEGVAISAGTWHELLMFWIALFQQRRNSKYLLKLEFHLHLLGFAGFMCLYPFSPTCILQLGFCRLWLN